MGRPGVRRPRTCAPRFSPAASSLLQAGGASGTGRARRAMSAEPSGARGPGANYERDNARIAWGGGTGPSRQARQWTTGRDPSALVLPPRCKPTVKRLLSSSRPRRNHAHAPKCLLSLGHASESPWRPPQRATRRRRCAFHTDTIPSCRPRPVPKATFVLSAILARCIITPLQKEQRTSLSLS